MLLILLAKQVKRY